MSKIIAAINMTLDGYCDHTAVDADEEIHRHYADLLRGAKAILYGRITYQLMEFWPPLVKQPSGNAAMDDFAKVMDQTPKTVFSHTLKSLDWHSSRLAKRSLEEEIQVLRLEEGKPVYLGSPSMIVGATNLRLVDEYQICIHPVIAGKGLPLFQHIQEAVKLQLVRSKTFDAGAVVHYYQTQLKAAE
jgi:dihydrofolate reductase